MTKEEIKAALHSGKKATHTYFTEKEYVFINAFGLYEFEDKVTQKESGFWNHYTNEAYNEGWEIKE